MVKFDCQTRGIGSCLHGATSLKNIRLIEKKPRLDVDFLGNTEYNKI